MREQKGGLSVLEEAYAEEEKFILLFCSPSRNVADNIRIALSASFGSENFVPSIASGIIGRLSSSIHCKTVAAIAREKPKFCFASKELKFQLQGYHPERADADEVTMPDLIILKIVPTRPTLAATFAQALRGLKITAYDINIQSLQGIEIGSASGVPQPEEPLVITPEFPRLETSIIQNYASHMGGPQSLKSVATAVIVVDTAPGLPPRPFYDLRFKIESNGLDLIDSIIEHNVQPYHLEVLSQNQQDYIAMESDVYIRLPASNVNGETPIAFVPLPADGQPPAFRSLLGAINTVLSIHAEGDSHRLELSRDPLSVGQAKQIASSIIWNRSLNPPPKPRHAANGFEELYTLAEGARDVDPDVDEDRKKFEDRLLGYHSTHDAEVIRLAGYIYAVSSAIFAERASSTATIAQITLPVDRGSQRTTGKGVTYQYTSVLLSGTADIAGAGRINSLVPGFTIPAAYFYVLSAMQPVQIPHEQRYNTALICPESQLRINFLTAIASGLLSASEAPITMTGPAINGDQAARRIAAIGTTAFSLPKVIIDPTISALVEEWLAYPGLTATMESIFWRANDGAISRHPTTYLNLLLHAITDGDLRLVSNIITNLNVTNVDILVGINDVTWTQFFSVNPDLLPAFTGPGSIPRRIEVWLQRLQKFFDVPRALLVPPPQPIQKVPSFGIPTNDAIGMFIREYNQLQSGTFTFAAPLDQTAAEVALHVVFPTDAKARTWLKTALETIRILWLMTDIGKPELQFSLMEALYARGFTTTHAVHRLPEEEFRIALTGTVAHPHALPIHARALSLDPPPLPIHEKPQLGFKPVNPDMTLTDCIPPPNLSPLGRVQYLHELLELDIGGTTIGDYIARRRGPLGKLLTSMANLETPIPTIDLVLESLEALGSEPISACGAVYDTNNEQLAGFNLSFPHDPPIVQPEIINDELSIRKEYPLIAHDAATILSAIPEHSTPATPVKSFEVYETLKTCFTSPALPYSQPLDINRTYLKHIGTTRFDTMRHFRQDITELPMDRNLEPTDFQSHLWRFPIRLEIALEFLGIEPEEYAVLYTGKITPEVTLELYGLPPNTQNWEDILTNLFEFLRRTGLTYPEFLEVWRSGYVKFERHSENTQFPDCEPCNLKNIDLTFGDHDDYLFRLRKLVTFIRLYRSLKNCRAPQLTFMQLSDICRSQKMFIDDTINSEFIRQLAAILVLRYYFGVPLSKSGILTTDHISLSPKKRTPILSLWAVHPSIPSAERQWAETVLLDQVEDFARHRYSCPSRGHGFKRELYDNLDRLAYLTGFTDRDSWCAKPTNTLRFVEVLSKIYASKFTIGEILFLFTTERHLQGDDPLPLPDPTEVEFDPLGSLQYPEHDLWSLRKKLLSVEIGDDEFEGWTWKRIVKAFQELGYPRHLKPSPLRYLGEHFFPKILESEYGKYIPKEKRRFTVDLPASKTSIGMWNAPHHGPFHYNLHQEPEELWIDLPLRNADVLKFLGRTRQLNTDEIVAVRELYFAPRALLAPYASMFSNFNYAVHYLVHEPSQVQRFNFFRREFVTFYHRCQVIAEHLTGHVSAATDGVKVQNYGVAWEVLRHMFADENLPAAFQPWENDSGEAPREYFWDGLFSGTAFGALVGLIGTGLVGEFSSKGSMLWREVGGDLTTFGEDCDAVNAPVPTILPSPTLALTPAQQQFAAIRNGFGIRDVDGDVLGGAQPFHVFWRGALLVENAGDYKFHAGSPRPGNDRPDFESAKNNRWLITLRRGQKFWTLLNHSWHADNAPDSSSSPIYLSRGAYRIDIYFEQNNPTFALEHCVKAIQTGFQIKYCGPDTNLRLVAISIRHVFLDYKSAPLAENLGYDHSSSAGIFLNSRYASSLRDIRRTYQRAFKGVLYAHRHALSAQHFHCEHENELRFLLEHPGNFLGTTYYRLDPAFKTHHAYFNLNFLPVTDYYLPPPPTIDLRVQPTLQRKAALFDWWERKFDYCDLRYRLKDVRSGPLWLLFEEAHLQHPPNPEQLLRHLDVDIGLSIPILNFFSNPMFSLQSYHFGDERAPIRVWHCGLWVKSLKRKFFTQRLQQALPALWASDDPGAVFNITSGNQNITNFVHITCFASGEPITYKEVQLINGELKMRARTTLFAYLCWMNRVPLLPFRGPHEYAHAPHDLTDLLLQDVEVGFGQMTSRVHEALSAVHNLVQRARLGLERYFKPTLEFVRLWDARFCDFETWEIQKRREVYRENWIEWEDIHEARQTEAFQLLESELRCSALSIPRNGGIVWWSNEALPRSVITEIQSRDMATLAVPSQLPNQEQGLQFLGKPDNDGRLSWAGTQPAPERPVSNHVDSQTQINSPSLANVTNGTNSLERLPLWFKSAIKMGTRFIRVAAAPLPPASVSDPLKTRNEIWCNECDKVHAPGMDEYFFWLGDAVEFDESSAVQNADIGAVYPDPTSDWHRPSKVRTLLRWNPRETVSLYWSRVHFGQFDTPRHSEEGISFYDLDPTAPLPQLTFLGRQADTLRFGTIPSLLNTSFRFDMATDSATVLTPISSPFYYMDINLYPRPLSSYPFFIYFQPGAPLLPPSTYSIAFSVATALRSHSRFDSALKWYEVAFNPLDMNNSWLQPRPASMASVTEDITCCTSDPRSFDIARGRAVLLNYLEVLLQWGDSLMSKKSSDTNRQALIVYDLIEKLLGPQPKRIHKHPSAHKSVPVSEFVAQRAPLNPRLLNLYEQAADRRVLIHHDTQSRQLSDKRDSLSFYTNHHHIGQPIIQIRHPYRFTYLLKRAMQLTTTVRELGVSLLKAFEKGDAQYLASMYATHHRQLEYLRLEIRKYTWRETDWQVQALERSLFGSQTRLTYYQTLIRNGLNAGENGSMVANDNSMAAKTGAVITEGIAQGLAFSPDMWFGTKGAGGKALDYRQAPIGSKLSSNYSTAARLLRALGLIADCTVIQETTEAHWERRHEFWHHEVDVLTIEVQQMERQIYAAHRRRDIAFRELNNHQRSIEHAVEVQNFMRDKFTKHDLYLFLQQEIAALYRQTFDLALDSARLAQRMFQYERCNMIRNFLPDGVWDNLREGLLAGERLQLALQTMQNAYEDTDDREYELIKHISLRLHFPAAFLYLKMTGSCEIDIPEWMYDLDYPGQYMRRIKNVTLTIPCIKGQYDGVHCRLQLLQSNVRVTSNLLDPLTQCGRRSKFQPLLPNKPTEPGNGYDVEPDDPRIHYQYGATESIATSTGQNDSGTFELQFTEDRYLPFEYAGAVGRWKLDLPRENNQFELDTLKDVMMHLKYTAREGGDILRKVANEAALKRLPGDGVRLFESRQDFPEAWTAVRLQHLDEKSYRDFLLRFAKNMFPFMTGNHEIRITRLDLFVDTGGAKVRENIVVNYYAQNHDFANEGCVCDTMKPINCIATPDWPNLFHGVLDCNFGPIGGNGDHEFGRLRFPRDLMNIQDIYLLCRYEVYVKPPPRNEHHEKGWGKDYQNMYGQFGPGWDHHHRELDHLGHWPHHQPQ